MENIFDWNCPARKRACGADLGEGDAVGNGTGGNAVENGTGGNAGRKWDRRKCGSEMGPSEVRAGMGSCGNAGRKWGGQGENLRLKPGDRGVRMRPRIAGASWMTGL